MPRLRQARDKRRPKSREPEPTVDPSSSAGGNSMFKHTTILASATLGLFLTTATLAQAQPSQAFQQAELAELSQTKRAEVQQRATGANTVREVLETMLLNNLQLRYPANRIVALDFGRGAVAYAVIDGSIRVANFNKTTLAISD
jgi:hypothetical protein